MDKSKAGKALGKASASKAGKASWAKLSQEERSTRARANRQAGWDRVKAAKPDGTR